MPDTISEKPISPKYLNFKKNWKEVHKFLDNNATIEQSIENLKKLEEQNMLSNEMLFVNSMVDFKPIYVSKNIERILGYTQKEFLSWESNAYFSISALDQSDFWENLLKWENEAKRMIPDSETYTKGRSYYCGISQVHKDGSIKRFLIRHESVGGSNFEVPEAILLYFEDITHFFKGNDYWMLFQNYTDKQIHTKFYKKTSKNDNLITPREKEVLELSLIHI